MEASRDEGAVCVLGGGAHVSGVNVVWRLWIFDKDYTYCFQVAKCQMTN